LYYRIAIANGENTPIPKLLPCARAAFLISQHLCQIITIDEVNPNRLFLAPFIEPTKILSGGPGRDAEKPFAQSEVIRLRGSFKGLSDLLLLGISPNLREILALVNR